MNRTATLTKMKDYSVLNICENMETQLLTNRTFNVKTGMPKQKISCQSIQQFLSYFTENYKNAMSSCSRDYEQLQNRNAYRANKQQLAPTLAS